MAGCFGPFPAGDCVFLNGDSLPSVGNLLSGRTGSGGGKGDIETAETEAV